MNKFYFLLLFIIPYLLYQFNTFVYGEIGTGISLTSVISPNEVKSGENTTFIISVKNNGNSTKNISSILLILPWEKKSENIQHPTILESNKIFTTRYIVHIPTNLTAGKYNAVISLYTNNSDYLGYSELTVKSIQGISLTGDIPFSVLAIVIPGILTYFIVIYAITKKFDRSYFEMGIVSVSFGILIWFIAGQITKEDIFTYLPRNHISYIIAFSIAVSIGILILILKFGLEMLFKKIIHYNKENQYQRDLIIKGYARNDSPVWVSFLKEHLSISQKLGEYLPMIRVILKDERSNSFSIPFVYGLIIKYEEEPPYHIALCSKYTIRCTKEQFKSILKDEKFPLKKELDNNVIFEKFCKCIKEFYPTIKIEKEKSFGELIKLIDDVNIPFKKILDFSLSLGITKHMDILIKLLEEEYSNGMIYEKGERFSYISGDTIAKVDVMSYETQYSVLIKDDDRNIEVPPPRKYKPWFNEDYLSKE